MSLCVCVQDTEMLMPLLWALSSTLSISVYNAKWEKVPVIPGGLEAGESRMKTEARGTLFCFGKACRAVCSSTSEGRTHLMVKSQFGFRLIRAVVPLTELLTGSVVGLRQN